MSAWDSYLDTITGSSGGNCEQALIAGLNDGSPWTSETNAKSLKNFKTSELQVIVKCMKSGDFTSFQANGVHIGGVKYQYLREMDGTVMAKKKDHGSITIQKSKTALVIAHTKEGGQQGETNKAVAAICEYLETSGC